MAGKIQRNNKTNKVSKKAKHARRTRRVSRKNNKSLNKRKQRKGGSFMSRLKGLSSGESSLGIFKVRCDMNEKTYNIEDEQELQITEGEFTNDDESESIKITRICRDDNGKITFVTNDKDKDKKRIDMKNFISKYPKYHNGAYKEGQKISIEYYFDENDNHKLKDKNPIGRARTKIERLKGIFGFQ